MNDYMKKRMQMINAGRPLKEKKAYSIPKVSKKRAEKIAKEKEERGDGGMDKWFEEMREWLNGKCAFCGAATTWKNKDLWRIAIAHLLPKAKFESVAKNSNNWTELCWDCHTNFDNGMISWEMLYDSHEWLMLREQLKLVLPLVAETERKNKLYDKLLKLVSDGLVK